MAKKKQKAIVIGVVLVALFFLVSSLNQGKDVLAVSGSDFSFTPVFCNDYEFTCCGEQDGDYLPSFEITDEIPYVCPHNSLKCEIENIPSTGSYYIGSDNCRMHSGWVADYWECDNEIYYEGTSIPHTLFSGQNLYLGGFPRGANNEVDITGIQILIERLDFCGGSGCSQGVPVLGADRCHFNPPTEKIYSEGGTPTEGISYTVPTSECILSFQQGNRHICGYKEESCEMDSECDGYTFGRYECTGRTLQEYGCRTFGAEQPMERDALAGIDSEFGGGDEQPSDDNTFGKRCEIISAQQVSCCGDTDCGLNMFCDVGDTWTCKADVSCTSDTQCGVTQQCDWTQEPYKLKTPACLSGACGWDEETVDCCNDGNCPSGYYCDANRECAERVTACTQCPYECCDDLCKSDGGFFDRACPDDKPFCGNGICSTTPPPAGKCDDCDAFALSYILGDLWGEKKCTPRLLALPPQTPSFCFMAFLKLALVPISFVLVWLFSGRFLNRFKQVKNNKILGIFLAVGMGVIFAYLVYTLFWAGVIGLVLYLIVSGMASTYLPKGRKR